MSLDKEEIYQDLIIALLDEFDRIRKVLRKARYDKNKARLWNNLFRCANTLVTLLKSSPEEGDIDEWLEMIAEKAPKKFVKCAKQIIEKSYCSGDSGGVKFSGMTRKDAGAKKVSKR